MELLHTVTERFLSELDFQSYRFVFSLALLLFAAKVAGSISQKLKQPAVLGELLGGIVVGPSLLGWVQPEAFLDQFAQIGVIVLMFIAGLETNSSLLKRVLNSALLVAVLGVAVPFFGGYFLGHVLGYPYSVNLILGTVLVATSVSITVQVLKEMGKLDTVEGTTILGAAVIDDVLGFLVLSVVFTVVSSSPSAIDMNFFVLLVCKLVLFFVLLWIGRPIASGLLYMLKRLHSRQLVTVGLILTAFTFSWLAETLGLAGIIGAYLIGLLLSTSASFAANKNEWIDSLEMIGYSIFIPIFFASIGLRLDLSHMNAQLITLSALITLVAIISKVIGCGAGARLSGMHASSSFRIGVGMVARGEVGLIVSMMAFQHGIIHQDLFSAAVLVVMLTTLLTPFLLNMAFQDT